MPASQRPNLNPIYLIMFFFATVGLIGIKTAEFLLNKNQPPEKLSLTAKKLELMSLSFPWLNALSLMLLGVGTVIFLVYFGLRIGGIRPVRQEPLNPVRWTTGALLKGLVVAFFLYIAMNIAGPALVIPLKLPKIPSFLALDTAIKVLIVLWILAILKFEYGARIRDAGISFKRPLRDTGYALLVYLAVMPIVTVVSIPWTWLGESMGLEFKPSPAIAWLMETDSMLTIVTICIAAVVVAPLIEEFFFRCFTYPALRKRLGVSKAVIISSAYFSLIHFDFFSFMPIMVLGVALAFLYERRQSIVAPAALHFFFNARNLAVVLFLKYNAQ